MGVVLGSAVVPTALCVSWSKANKWGCIAGAILGFFTGIMGWLVTTASLNGGVVNVMTGGGDIEMLVGNIISLSVGGVIAVVWSYMYPADFDFTITRAINAPHYHTSNLKETKEDDDRKVPSTQAQSVGNVAGLTQDCDLDFVKLNKAFKFAAWSSITLGIILIVVIPLPLFFMQILYGVQGFQAWVVIGIIWVFTSCMAVILLPLWESREALKMVSCGVIK
ncbi:putative urea active transporter 1, partial [Termitomyces sp. T112]